jgi:hypothetical protein
MIWWQGKITGVEQLSNFLFLLSIYILIKTNAKSKTVGSIIYGLAIGAKLPVLLMMPFFLSLLIKTSNKSILDSWRILPKTIFFIFIGYFISNSYLINSPSKIFSPLYAPSVAPSGGRDRLFSRILYGNEFGWDAIFNGGPLTYGLHYVILIPIIILLIRQKKMNIIIIGYFLSLFLTVILCKYTADSFGWYFISLIYLVPFIFDLTTRNALPLIWKRNILVFIILISSVVNANVNFEMISRKVTSIKNYENKSSLINYLNRNEVISKADLIVDLTDYGFTVKDASKLEGSKFISDTKIFSYSNLYKNKEIDWLVKFREQHIVDSIGIVSACEQLKGYKTIALVVNERYVRNNVWYSADKSFGEWLQENIVNKCPVWEITSYDFFENTHIVFFVNKYPLDTNIFKLRRLPYFDEYIDSVFKERFKNEKHLINNSSGVINLIFPAVPDMYYSYNISVTGGGTDCMVPLIIDWNNNSNAIYQAVKVFANTTITLKRVLKASNEKITSGIIQLKAHEPSCNYFVNNVSIMEMYFENI